MWDWKQQLKLAGCTVLAQIFGWQWAWDYSRGLSKLKAHILKERTIMTRKLWLKIMYRDNWRCQIRLQGCTYRAQEVDHIIPLFRNGTTIESNLQAACHNCNLHKGTRLL